MLIDYRMVMKGALTPKQIPLAELAERTGIEEGVEIMFADHNGVHVYISYSTEGIVTGLRLDEADERPPIFAEIEQIFGVDMVSEYEPRHWGFATTAEWTAAIAEREWTSELARRAMEAEILASLRSDDDAIPGVWEEDIARLLAKHNPEMLRPELGTGLIELLRDLYRRHKAQEF
jgi:hypothetical protein